MPVDQPGSLSRAQLAAVVACILKVDVFPAGETAPDPQALTSSGMRIVSTPP